ncbi:MAG: c-type cytochrome [Wenzhouxiangellaceae bacterium]
MSKFHPTPRTMLLSSATVLAIALAAGAVHAEVPEACVACHNDDGIATDPAVPTLAGNAAFFIENQMFLFQQEDRPCGADYFAARADVEASDHCSAVAELSEDDIAAIGEAYEGMDFAAFEQDVDEAMAAKGEELHDAGCDRCHSEAGSEPFDEAGLLAGQPKPYMIANMKYYRDGERWQPESMQSAMENLSDEDIAALAEYYAREGLSRF